jgi:Trk K+ transport system NAD-binding subunit
MLCHELKASHGGFVVIDHSEERIAAARNSGYFVIHGDATDEDVMRQAGVMRARALATVLPEDAANVFITLSARSLKRDLTIIARGELPSTESKLIQAGANRVVLPARIGAERVAELLLHRDMTRLIAKARGGNLDRLALDLQSLGLDIDVTTVDAGSPCAGLTVTEIEARGAGAFLVVALERQDGQSILQPEANVSVAAGDGLALVRRPGKAQQVDELFQAPSRDA